MGIHFCFQWRKNYRNQPRIAGVIVENTVALFSVHDVYIPLSVNEDDYRVVFTLAELLVSILFSERAREPARRTIHLLGWLRVYSEGVYHGWVTSASIDSY